MKKYIVALALLLSPIALFAQTAEELIANRAPVGAHIGHFSENPYWMAPAVRARLGEIAEDVLARVTSDADYQPSDAERNLVGIWWGRDGMNQRLSAASLEFVKRIYPVNPGFATAHIRRWIVTPADYAALKSAGYSVHGISLLPNFTNVVASLATRFGDFAAIAQMDRSQIFRSPYTTDDYKAWLRWKNPQFASDQDRYEYLQSEITLVGLATSEQQQRAILAVLQQASDLYFQRLRRAQLLGTP